eukprot:TRINITY_DN8300_c0_g1_i1.p1 TRINITY_DN8300_c0_g1~~TRINITY_DN8300_c0_g1_i1.p1  ORF type:complete len:506 (+),score=139.01 TRINITY_DN8300_c0_g1_i1:134-1651(+)
MCIRDSINAEYGGGTARAMEGAVVNGDAAPPELVDTQYRVVWHDGVNVRQFPSVDAAVVGELEWGDVVDRLELSDGWLKHELGWSKLSHQPSGLHFLAPRSHAVQESSYLQQRAAVERRVLDFLAGPGGPESEVPPPEDDGKAWAVLICGGARSSQYGNSVRRWRDLGGDIPFLLTLGGVYDQLASELGSERTVVIAGLADAIEWLQGMAELGYSEPFDPADRQASMAYYGDAAQSKRKWAARLLELQHRCATLLEAGGADYDHTDVNPTTILRVLSGDTAAGGKVVPHSGVRSLFLWVTTHGSAHPISVDVKHGDGASQPVPIAPEEECDQSASLDLSEWFFICPHRATDERPYGFVRAAGYPMCPTTDPSGEHDHLPLFCVYWSQMFRVLHLMQQREPQRRVVCFYQFCLSGGHLLCMTREAFVQQYQVDKWPVAMIASAGALQNSTGAVLTNLFMQAVRQGLSSACSLGQLLQRTHDQYWDCLLYTSPSPRDRTRSRMPSSA